MKAVILHGYSDSNKGDLAIVVGMVKGLRAARPNCDLILQSVYSESDPEFEFHHRFVRKLGVKVQQMSIPSPYVDSQAHSVTRNLTALCNLMRDGAADWLAMRVPGLGFLFPRQREAITSLRNADVVLLKGGQYIYNDQGGLRALLYLWRILHPIGASRRLGKDVVMLGQSVGPLVDERGRRMTARALGHCSLLVVRERKSAALLEELGLAKSMRLAPDFAFLIEPVPPDRFPDTCQAVESGRWLGVTVVNWTFPDSGNPAERRDAYLDALVAVAQRVHHSTGVGIVLFPQVTVQHHGESDLDLLRRFAARLADVGVPHRIVEDDLAPEELSYLYGRCEALLGTRLHSCILAACAFTPVVAIRYQGFKTEGVMAELGLEANVFDIAAMDADGIVKALLHVMRERDSVSASIRKRVGSFRQELMAVLEEAVP